MIPFPFHKIKHHDGQQEIKGNTIENLPRVKKKIVQHIREYMKEGKRTISHTEIKELFG